MFGPEEPGEPFEEFYLATAEQVVRVITRMAAGNSHLGEEISQQAYVAMLECWPKRRHASQEDNRRYVIGIAAKKLADWYRRLRDWDAIDDENDCPAVDPGFDKVLNELSVFKAVRDLIEQQPAHRRSVGVLYFVEEWPYQEIAEALAISESTVRTQIERLRGHLKPLIHQLYGGGERS
ncbi:sigma-70 family RNA polymerase sigma factor [Saccharopolyspora taberi]|uniref:RNA polymerase sigma factor 70 region 4 type 2 domain-containing protein n=1 Tax=Saccharopolyspora taberi TaxID=60895 RepID=A0ABN3VN80_9PSEU